MAHARRIGSGIRKSYLLETYAQPSSLLNGLLVCTKCTTRQTHCIASLGCGRLWLSWEVMLLFEKSVRSR